VDINTLPRRPNLLLVSLGTNDAANMAVSKGRPEPIVSDVQKLIARFAPGDSIWIGPPWLGNKITYYTNADNEKLYAAAHRAGAAIFDSRVVTRSAVEGGSGDGVHLGPAGQKVWAAAVVKKATESTMPWLLLGGVAVATAAAVYIATRE
jgi:lysophospholipase L1-like esterase